MNANTIKERIIELNKVGYPFKEIYNLAEIPSSKFSKFMNNKHNFREQNLNKLNIALSKIENNTYSAKKFERIPKKYL